MTRNRDNPQRFFFDRDRVIGIVGKATAKAMAKAGAFIRRSAQFSIRSRNRVSKPGEAPTSQTGLLRQHIYFSLDPRKRSLVVGPIRFNASHTAYSVPQLLEFGGVVPVTLEQLSGGRWVRKGTVRNQVGFSSRPTKIVQVTIAPRPYMRPALEKNRDKIAAFWRGAMIGVK